MAHPHTEGTTSPAASALEYVVRDPKGAADQAARQVGDTLTSAAEHVREQMPDSGIIGQVADVVSGRIKQTATRLQEQGYGPIIDEVVAHLASWP